MNSTSFGSRLVSSAARSPGRSSTGPEVWRRLTPSSLAMMCARVVLPRPGGPKSSTWSSASPRARAAWMKISSWPRTFSWPTYSASVAGRSERSICCSCWEDGLAEMRRSVSTLISAFCQRASEAVLQAEREQVDLGVVQPLVLEAQAEAAREMEHAADADVQLDLVVGLDRAGGAFELRAALDLE